MEKERCFKSCLKENKISVISEFARPARTWESSTQVVCCPVAKRQMRGRSPIKAIGDDSPLFDKGTKAFTLIELLVVVLIIGILAAVALPQYQKAVLRSRLSTLKNMAESVATAQEIYYMANGVYATKIGDLDIEFPSGGERNEEDNLVTYDWGFCSLEDPKNTQCGSSTYVLRYLAYHNTGTSYAGKRMCQSKKDTLTEKVCQQDTGDTACLHWGEGGMYPTCRYN